MIKKWREVWTEAEYQLGELSERDKLVAKLFYEAGRADERSAISNMGMGGSDDVTAFCASLKDDVPAETQR